MIASITLKKVKETKNTVRYDTDNEDVAVTSVYVQKSWLEAARPDHITLTIEVADG